MVYSVQSHTTVSVVVQVPRVAVTFNPMVFVRREDLKEKEDYSDPCTSVSHTFLTERVVLGL